jgi:ribonuclease D
VRHVLPDLALQAIAHAHPRSLGELRAIRGMDGRYLRPPAADELLAAIARGTKLPEADLHLPPVDDVPRESRPAVALAAAWVAQLARNEELDASVLATRGDLVAFLRDAPDARLAQGWRATMLGEQLRRLAAGDASLAFDGRGNLVLEARSRQPFGG